VFEVNKENCIGCGACVSMAPEIFSFDEDGLAEAKKETIPKESGIQPLESCPVNAISYIEKE